MSRTPSDPSTPIKPADEETSRRMGRIRQHGTSAELTVRKLLRELGLHYRVRNRDLPGSPDLANRSKRWAVFVHGCYWHRHDGCSRTTTPKRNADFWKAKFEANVARDARSIAALRRDTYRVIVIWECELRSIARVRARLSRFAHKTGHPSTRRDARPR